MVKITNGVLIAKVTRGAFEAMYKPQGYKIIKDNESQTDSEQEEWNDGEDEHISQ